MRGVIISAVVILAFVALTTEGKQSPRYKSWKARFGKKNDDPKTEEARSESFDKNCALIDKHNDKFLNGSSTFFVDLNEHSALLPHELEGLKGLKRPDANKGRHRRYVDYNTRWSYGANRLVFYPYVANSTAPKRTQLDWRTVWSKPIENQGNCGSCWAFSAANVIDAVYKIKKNLTISSSKQELLDCSGYLGNGGCNGGDQGLAFEYAATKGLGAEKSYRAYNYTQGTCTKLASPNYFLKTFAIIDNNEEALRQAVDDLGVLTVSLDVSSDPLFMSYKGGIYNGNGKCRNTVEYLDHAVVLVGYGVDAATNASYWIIRNSWGTSWGEAGYMRLARNQNNACGVAAGAYGAILA